MSKQQQDAVISSDGEDMMKSGPTEVLCPLTQPSASINVNSLHLSSCTQVHVVILTGDHECKETLYHIKVTSGARSSPSQRRFT